MGPTETPHQFYSPDSTWTKFRASNVREGGKLDQSDRESAPREPSRTPHISRTLRCIIYTGPSPRPLELARGHVASRPHACNARGVYVIMTKDVTIREITPPIILCFSRK